MSGQLGQQAGTQVPESVGMIDVNVEFILQLSGAISCPMSSTGKIIELIYHRHVPCFGWTWLSDITLSDERHFVYPF